MDSSPPREPSRTSARRERRRPLAAWRALRRLIANPDDTRRVFEIIDALSGDDDRMFRRFRATPTGRTVLREQRDLLDSLSDRAALATLPEGSLGRCYADFMAREQISADGLVAASEQAGSARPTDTDRERFGTRLRDSHDLWHVVTGYDRDLVGEASLLAFTYAQTRNLGIAVIVAMAYWLARGDAAHGRRMIREGYRRGRRCAWLPAADWEAWLAEPLEDVRRRLAVGAPPAYEPLRSEAGRQAALAAG